MIDRHQKDRRHFLRTMMSAIEVGAVATALPWSLRSASASVPGRALIGFQVLPSWMNLLATILTEIHGHYEPDLGVKAVVVPGNAGSHALEVVHQSPRDGATVLISPSTVLTMTPALKKLPADPADGLVPIAPIGEIPFAFLVGPAVPLQVRTAFEYFTWLRSNPGSNRYGVPGLGTAPHFVGSEMSRLADASMHAVGYRGSAALLEDVANGSVPAGLTVVPGLEDSVRFPQVRMLAVAGNRHLAHLPDIPTLRESGYAESFPGETLGFFMPMGTPDENIQQLRTAVEAAIRTRAVSAAMAGAAIIPLLASSRTYPEVISAERAQWRTLVSQHDFDSQG